MTPAPNSARVRVQKGPLVGPVLSRVVAMVAARADCPVDRLEDALLITDGIAAHGSRLAGDGVVELRVDTSVDGLELRSGPYREKGGASTVLRNADVPGLGNVMERLADAVSVESDGEGEHLVISLRFARAAEA